MRRVWSLMVVMLLGYSAILVLVYLFQERLVYFPEMGREFSATPAAMRLAFEDAGAGSARRGPHLARQRGQYCPSP
jgi:hypothetical protein